MCAGHAARRPEPGSRPRRPEPSAPCPTTSCVWRSLPYLTLRTLGTRTVFVSAMSKPGYFNKSSVCSFAQNGARSTGLQSRAAAPLQDSLAQSQQPRDAAPRHLLHLREGTVLHTHTEWCCKEWQPSPSKRGRQQCKAQCAWVFHTPPPAAARRARTARKRRARA